MSDVYEIKNVSRETVDLLKEYEKLVIEWNNKFNLISKSTVEQVWDRHILDSVQLIHFITEKDKILYDLGSGAGFPGIVIAILAKQYFPKLKIFLVESIKKKALFLETVIKELMLNAEVINDRIENIKNKKADIVTSRALANLPKLIEYTKPLSDKETKLLALKGEKWQEEIQLAEKEWFFDVKTVNSKTNNSGRILIISNIRRKKSG